MAINKGIPVINNFDLYAQKSLDSRLVIENEQELGELINKGAVYDGMIFYRKDAQKFFQAQYLESGLKISEFASGSGGNVGTINLTQDQYNDATENGQITFTTEQANLIKQDDIGTIIFKFGELSLYKMTLTKIFAGTIDDNIVIYTLSSYMKSGTFNVLYLIAVSDFSQPAPISIIGLPDKYLSDVKIGSSGYGTNCLEFSVGDGDFFIRLYTDKINGVPIIHNLESESKNYNIPTIYNHFIYLALETTTKGTATIRINFTSSLSETINTLDKLKTALGSTFTLGGNGSIVNGSTYGTTYMLNQNGITGVLNGAQSVFNFTDGTLTITDSVKQA